MANHTLRLLRPLAARLLLAAAMIAGAPSTATAQRIIAERTVADVGKTGYQHPVTAVFEFRNKSIRRLKINDVRPDCHCTAVDFPKHEIGIGERFQVRMTYDARQLGHFDHQAAVVSNGSKKPIYIRMKGVVLAGYEDIAATYPTDMGDLLVDRDVMEFDDINKGFLQVQELRIYNPGPQACQPNLMHLPEYLTATATPATLPAGSAGKITVTLNSALLQNYGLTQTAVYLAAHPGDKVRADHEVSVSAVLLPPFDELTAEQRETAPHLTLSADSLTFVFGNKRKKTETITLTNSGSTPLNISSLQMFTKGLQISLGKQRLASGEHTKLRITAFSDVLRTVRSRPRILMITNDPDRPKVIITVGTK